MCETHCNHLHLLDRQSEDLLKPYNRTAHRISAHTHTLNTNAQKHTDTHTPT